MHSVNFRFKQIDYKLLTQFNLIWTKIGILLQKANAYAIQMRMPMIFYVDELIEIRNQNLTYY
jgi:hypothetical protein